MGVNHPPPSHNGKQLTHDTTMTRWHASTELRLTTADAVVAKTVYLAAKYLGQLESGLGMDSAELDTSG